MSNGIKEGCAGPWLEVYSASGMTIVLRRVDSMCEVSAPAVISPESTAAAIAKTM